jgi:hypothetical protein
MHPVILMLPFPVGILNVECKVSLISLIAERYTNDEAIG